MAGVLEIGRGATTSHAVERPLPVLLLAAAPPLAGQRGAGAALLSTPFPKKK